MIQLLITETGKGYNPKDAYTVFNKQTKEFKDIPEAMQYIKDTYGKSKREKMYVDVKGGGSKHVGYVIGFRNSDISHFPVEKWLQQDWITFEEVTTVDLGKKR